MSEPSHKHERELRSRLTWLTFFRAVIITTLTGGILAVHLAGESPLNNQSLRAFDYVIGSIYAACILYALALKFWNRMRALAYVQFIVDALFITGIVFVSSGVSSVFTFFYIFSIFGAAIVLGRSGAFVTASMSSIFYGLLVDLQYFSVISPFNLQGAPDQLESGQVFLTVLANISAFYAVAFLASHLQGQLSSVRVKLRQQSRNLMELEALNDRIVESISSGLLTLDRNGRIVSFNTAAQSILGYSFEDVWQRSVADILPGFEDYMTVKSGNSISGFSMSRGEITVETGEKKTVCLGFSVSPLTTVSGEEIGRILIFQDITEVKRMQAEMKRLERLAIMGTLAAGMAHEIKNPLGAMSGAFQMLRGENVSAPIADRLMGIMEREMSRLNDLLNEFLWLSKPAKREGALKTVPLEPLIDDTITLIRTKLGGDGGVEYKKNVPPAFSVMVDESHFRQVIWNILLNGVEAMNNRGSMEITAEMIEVSGADSERSNYARISFRDSGPGITDEIREKIYEPFFTTKETGTGLGLAIVQKIVDSHQGHIEITSEPDRGSTFSILLPETPQQASPSPLN
jgi:two-component system, NtrC family, sensor histidine kinase PilS